MIPDEFEIIRPKGDLMWRGESDQPVLGCKMIQLPPQITNDKWIENLNAISKKMQDEKQRE